MEFGSADETDAALVSVPPYHIAGIAAIASSVYSGRQVVQLPNFEASDWLELYFKSFSFAWLLIRPDELREDLAGLSSYSLLRTLLERSRTLQNALERFRTL